MVVNRDTMVKSCQRSGFVGFDNTQVSLTPAVLSTNEYYSPVRYPGTLNAHATSEEDCRGIIQTFLIAYGVVIFIVMALQDS